jgi:hypothetical protein
MKKVIFALTTTLLLGLDAQACDRPAVAFVPAAPLVGVVATPFVPAVTFVPTVSFVPVPVAAVPTSAAVRVEVREKARPRLEIERSRRVLIRR